jgi:hypothetical protein
MNMQTLIGTDGLLTRLSGAIEISGDGPQIIISGRPGPGVPTQRIIINSDKILDVETLSPAPKPRVTVERNWKLEGCIRGEGHDGDHEWKYRSRHEPSFGQCLATRQV